MRFANLGGDLDRFKAVVAGVADAGIVAAEFMAVAPKDVKMLVAGHDALPNYVRLCLTMTGKTIAIAARGCDRFYCRGNERAEILGQPSRRNDQAHARDH